METQQKSELIEATIVRDIEVIYFNLNDKLIHKDSVLVAAIAYKELVVLEVIISMN